MRKRGLGLQRNDQEVPVLACENLVKHFPHRRSGSVVQAVNDVSFEVFRGETFGLVGESGSGKTTVGRLILGLIEPTAGRVSFDGQNISALTNEDLLRVRPKIQAVFQDPYDALDPRMRVRDAIIQPLARMALLGSRDERRQRVGEVLEIVGLDRELASRYPHELSGGQQQRVGVARALAPEPDFIVLDEPTSALSPSARAELIALLGEVQERLKVAYLFISHDLKVVESIANTVGVMYLGKIVELGGAQEVFENRVHPYTQALLSSVLAPDPSQRGSVKILRGEIPSPIDLPDGCSFLSRCPIGDESCGREEPPLTTVDLTSIGQKVACFKASTAANGRQTRTPGIRDKGAADPDLPGLR